MKKKQKKVKKSVDKGEKRWYTNKAVAGEGQAGGWFENTQDVVFKRVSGHNHESGCRLYIEK